jgi:hypothetical protein
LGPEWQGWIVSNSTKEQLEEKKTKGKRSATKTAWKCIWPRNKYTLALIDSSSRYNNPKIPWWLID